nr:hypothetical protein [Streptomyces hygroscopicus]
MMIRQASNDLPSARLPVLAVGTFVSALIEGDTVPSTFEEPTR